MYMYMNMYMFMYVYMNYIHIHIFVDLLEDRPLFLAEGSITLQPLPFWVWAYVGVARTGGLTPTNLLALMLDMLLDSASSSIRARQTLPIHASTRSLSVIGQTIPVCLF